MEPLIIRHRRNTVDQLINTDNSFGVEIDVRSYGSDLILSHDPFIPGCIFGEWLREYRHNTLIVNLKEEGLEEAVLSLLKEYKISNYFLLDQSFPFLIKYLRLGHTATAVRVSEYESVQTLAAVTTYKPEWVWLDHFTSIPGEVLSQVKPLLQNLKICVVSPELQGYEKNKITELQLQFQMEDFTPHAVCTKYPDMWQR